MTLRGDWMDTAAPLTLVRGADGVWKGTTEPPGPDYYSYALTVDGVRTLDPKNALIKQGIASVDNMFFVPGPCGRWSS